MGVVNPEAIQLARESDKRRAAGKSRGVLEGIPIMIKDIFLTQDDMPSTGNPERLQRIQLMLTVFIVSEL